MKLLLLMILCCTTVLAQSGPPQTPPTGGEANSAKAAPATPDRSSAQTSVPADIKEVRRNLEALKTAVNKMDEGPAHDAAEQNVKFLESLVSYLEHENVARTQSGTTPRSSRRPHPNIQAPQGVAGENPNPKR